MTPALAALAQAAGIAPGYHDLTGGWRATGEDTARALLAAFGLPAATEDEAATTLARLEAEDAPRALPHWAVVTAGAEASLHPRWPVDWVLVLEDGGRLDGRNDADDGQAGETAASRGKGGLRGGIAGYDDGLGAEGSDEAAQAVEDQRLDLFPALGPIGETGAVGEPRSVLEWPDHNLHGRAGHDRFWCARVGRDGRRGLRGVLGVWLVGCGRPRSAWIPERQLRLADVGRAA